jgi:predicted membrane protein
MEPKRLFGVVLLLLGVLFGMRTLELLPEALVDLLFRWELILIGLGIYLMASERKGNTGLILFLIGLVFWIPDAFDLPEEFSIWPILLILLGVYLLLRSGGRKRPEKARKGDKTGERRNRLQETVLFGSSDRIIASENFQGGDVMVLFGEAKLDLTRCKWGEGDRELEVFFLFGSGTIHLPPEWELDLEVTPIFGSFSDRREQKIEGSVPEQERVRITGFSIFGDGKLKE